MYDIIFLSYDEPNYRENWERLKDRFPHAQHVHGVKGIGEAHRAAALLAQTESFWVIDGDTILDDKIDLLFKWPPHQYRSEENRVGVWRARNSLNAAVYGNGGVKLFPRSLVLKTIYGSYFDFTYSLITYEAQIVPMEECISTTVINQSAIQAWRASFRECFKLTRQILILQRDNREIDTDWSRQRLRQWANPYPDANYRDDSHLGVYHGIWAALDESRADDIDINDYHKLMVLHLESLEGRERFKNYDHISVENFLQG